MNQKRDLEAAQRRARRRRLFKVAVVAFLLLGQELVSRLLFPLPEVIGFNRIRYQLLAPGDARSRSSFQRGLVYDRLKFESQPDGFSEIHRLNLYGFRGNDFPIAPPPGRRRILILGDSVVEGQGAAETATISNRFADLLKIDGTNSEIINLGVVAASLRELTPLARDSIALLNPTDLILVLYANDLPAPPYPRDFDLPAPLFPRQNLCTPRLFELFVRIASHKPIYRRWPPHPIIPFFLPRPDPTNPWTHVKDPPQALDPALYQAMSAGKINPWLWQQSQAIPGMLSHDFSRGEGSPARYLERVAALCKAGHVRLVVAYVPFCAVTSERYAPSLVKMGMERSIAEALGTDPNYRRQNEILASLCRDLNLSLADTTQALVEAEKGGIAQYWPYDTHPSPPGYATIAHHIYEVWRESAEN